MNEREIMGVKSVFSGQLGEKTEAMHEAALREAGQFKGGADALTMQIKKFESLYDQIDRDRDGKDEIKDGAPFPRGGSTELEVAAYAKQQVKRCEEAMRNFSLQLRQRAAVAEGKAVALEGVVTLMQNHHNVANSRIQQLEAKLELDAEVAKALGIERGEIEPPRDAEGYPAGHPGPRRSQLRQQEEVSASPPEVPESPEGADTAPAVEPAPVAKPEPVEAAPVEPPKANGHPKPKKRRSRRAPALG